MYERKAVSLLEKRVVFVATVSGITPQIRPMRARIDAAGIVYLYCPASRRAGEIAINNQAAVCVLDDDGALLHLNGQLEPVLAEPGTAVGLDGATYRLRIHSVLFSPSVGESYGQSQCPCDLDGVLLQPESRLTLTRR